MTLIEALISMLVAAVGVLGITSMLIASSTVVRRTYTNAQALALAQRELELISSRGCDGTASPPNCDNVTVLDGTVRQLWYSTTSGVVLTAPTAADPTRRPYRVAVDVDAPGFFEGAERGEPLLNRGLDGAAYGAGAVAGTLVNVRVTVSWEEPLGTRRAVALQTRMAP